MKERQFFVYILAIRKDGRLYIGVTPDLIDRIREPKNDVIEGFTKRYRVHMLVWFEIHRTAISAITREKRIKKWNRSWKIELIETENQGWLDLFDGISV